MGEHKIKKNNPAAKNWLHLSLADSIQTIIMLGIVTTTIITLLLFCEQKNFNKSTLRPWISIELTSSTIKNSDFALNRKSFTLFQNFQIKNLGTQPAHNVKVFGIFGPSDSTSIKNVIDSDEKYFSLNSNLLSKPSLTIFPNQTLNGDTNFPIDVQAEILNHSDINYQYAFATLALYEDNEGNQYKTKIIFKNDIDFTKVKDAIKITYSPSKYEIDYSYAK
ncbi:MAG: hypothetical protein GYA14_03775 [Ignavibacteria bacterium]|nr:hypothetical protein [Ignavibacteria bacterium]